MAKRLTLVLAIVLAVVLATGTVWGAQQEGGKYVSRKILGNEYPDYLISKASGVLVPQPLSPYDNILGYTWYDYQHNSRIPRMNANDYQTNRGLHFNFMEMEEPPGNRFVDYNYWDSEGWTAPPPPSDRITVPTGRAGYTGVALIRPLGETVHSRAVVCHHYTQPVWPDDEEFDAVIVIEPNIPGGSAMTGGQYFYDVNDFVNDASADFHGMWPACAVDSLNRIHIVMGEGDTGAGLGWMAYTRCYEIPDDSIVCESPGIGEFRIAKETFYTDQDWEAAVYDSTASLSHNATSSKVSNRVALIWAAPAATLTDSGVGTMQNCNDIFYLESLEGGDDWFSKGGFAPRTNVTQYQPDDPYRSYGEVCGLYDFNDSLHLFWVGQGYDQANATLDPDDVVLYHWSKASERICNGDFYPGNKVQQLNWDTFPYTGGWNRGIAKIQSGIGIIDSTIDPPNYNKNYLYVQWTQFDDVATDPTLFNQAENFVQGELYATLSTDFGFTWMSPVNLTNSTVDHCATGNCASDHWSSMAERVDTCFYSQWIYDRDAGGYPQEEGEATNNEVLFKAFPVSTVPIVSEARIAWAPAGWTTVPINIPVKGDTTVYLTLENIGTDALNISSISTAAGWLTIGSYPSTITAGGCPAKVSLTVDGQGSCAFYVGSINVQSNDQAGNSNINIPIHVVEDDNFAPADFRVVDNRLFYLGVSNTGNLGHQNDTTGMWLYTDLAETEANFIFDGSPAIGYVVPGDAVPASAQNDTVVGRYIFDEHYLQSAAPVDSEHVEGLSTIRIAGEFWPVRIQVPPEDQYWPWWKGQIQEHVMYSGDSTAKMNWNERYMTLVVLKLFHDTPPCWWASISPPSSYPTTLLGMVIDVDSPSDSGAWNYPGYDETQRMAWLQGYGGGVKENYTFALAQRDTCYALAGGNWKCWPNPATLTTPDQPYAMHVLRNDAFVYPQNGFRDDSLYKYMNMPGYAIYGDGIEEDYTIVNTGAVIGTHSLTDTFEVRYAMLATDKPLEGKAMASKLDTLVASIQCGNCDRDMVMGLADVVYYITYLFKGGGEVWKYMSDADGNCTVGLADVVYLIGYLFKGGPPPRCSCSTLR